MDNWREDARAAGFEPQQRHWDEIAGLYADRPYHNLAHVAEVRNLVLALGGVPATRIAAWYHDAIYEPGSEGNERASADLARRHLIESGATAGVTEEVERLVLVTEHHEPAIGDRQGEILCDADLAILSSEPLRYLAYVDQIRREYALVPDREFWAGRLQVLQKLLERDRIYRTDQMENRESAAIVNMRTELGWLQIQIGNAR